jgi:hypothetical protein
MLASATPDSVAKAIEQLDNPDATIAWNVNAKNPRASQLAGEQGAGVVCE